MRQTVIENPILNSPFSEPGRHFKFDEDGNRKYFGRQRPFPVPSKGKIAVKVINHYGDEVLNVYEVGEKGK